MIMVQKILELLGRLLHSLGDDVATPVFRVPGGHDTGHGTRRGPMIRGRSVSAAATPVSPLLPRALFRHLAPLRSHARALDLHRLSAGQTAGRGDAGGVAASKRTRVFPASAVRGVAPRLDEPAALVLVDLEAGVAVVPGEEGVAPVGTGGEIQIRLEVSRRGIVSLVMPQMGWNGLVLQIERAPLRWRRSVAVGRTNIL